MGLINLVPPSHLYAKQWIIFAPGSKLQLYDQQTLNKCFVFEILELDYIALSYILFKVWRSLFEFDAVCLDCG